MDSEGYPLVHIIVLTWNGREDTLECLRSLRKITYPHYEILLVDNASTDGTDEAIKSQFSNVEYIRNKENLRFAAGNNVGIDYALNKNADYILLINNDIIVKENFLNELIATSENDQNIGMV